MTEATFEGLSKGGKFRVSIDSVTTESKIYKTGRINLGDSSVTLKFRDTVGFGAKDMESKTILKDTFLEVVADFDKIRGCVLVHKCERYREGGAQDIQQIQQMLSTMGLDITKHLLLVITHTGHLSEEVQEAYSKEIRERVLKDIPADRVIHVNFANLDELNDYHRNFYLETRKDEWMKLLNKLKEFEDEVAPASSEIKEYFQSAYTEDLRKRPRLFGLL